MQKRVVVLGGGVGGMSAAHELAERGFAVEVFEGKDIPGGKARSVPVPHSASEGRKPLPGEHGFRFFPGFYRHLPDTMKRIPFGSQKQGVFDNLVTVDTVLLARMGQQPLKLLTHLPRSWDQLKLAFSELYDAKALGLDNEDVEYYADKMWRVLTSCQARRLNEYGRVSWWDFIDAPQRSQAYQQFLGIGLTRNLVAAKAETASARTVGDIALQLYFSMLMPGIGADRVLNGPTNEVWIEPWLKHLETLGVQYHLRTPLTAIERWGGKIRSVTVRQDGAPREVTADYYVFAVPVEVMARFLRGPDQPSQQHRRRYPDSAQMNALIAADPTLEGIVKLRTEVAWMNGIQYYLKVDVMRGVGHVNYLDSPWALTSISQQQYWPDYPLAERGDGTVRGVLSVDISEWEADGLPLDPANPSGPKRPPAKDCTADQIADEVWKQLKASLNVGGETVLRDADVHSWYLDRDIRPSHVQQDEETDTEPLLVNLVNSWNLRPDAYTRIPNLFLAADYVRTNTDLATMEGANEAARRAVNAILLASGSPEPLCEVWSLHEPEILEPFRLHDSMRYDKGLPWTGVLEGATDWLDCKWESVKQFFSKL